MAIAAIIISCIVIVTNIVLFVLQIYRARRFARLTEELRVYNAARPTT